RRPCESGARPHDHAALPERTAQGADDTPVVSLPQRKAGTPSIRVPAFSPAFPRLSGVDLMKSNISGGGFAAIIAVATALILFFGYRYISGGPAADVSQQNLEYYKKQNAMYRANAAQGQAAKTPGKGGLSPEQSH